MNTEQLHQLIHEIAELIDCGLVCFLNPETFEHIDVPQGILDYRDGIEFYEEDLAKIDNEWPRFIRIEPLESSEAFRIMEDFTDDVIEEGRFKQQVIEALNRKKPFSNFKGLVEGSKYRNEWYKYKLDRKEEYVRDIFEANNLFPNKE